MYFVLMVTNAFNMVGGKVYIGMLVGIPSGPSPRVWSSDAEFQDAKVEWDL